MLLEESKDCSFVKSNGCEEVTKENAQVIYFQCNCSGRSQSIEEKQHKQGATSQGDYLLNFLD